MTKENTSIDKAKILEELAQRLRQKGETFLTSALDAQEEATLADGANQSKSDTRKIEQSWLADALGRRYAATNASIERLQEIDPSTQKNEDSPSITIGSLVCVEYEGQAEEAWFLLVPFKGGDTLESDDIRVKTISADSPIGQNILGKNMGDPVETMAGKRPINFTIQRVL